MNPQGRLQNLFYSENLKQSSWLMDDEKEDDDRKKRARRQERISQ